MKTSACDDTPTTSSTSSFTSRFTFQVSPTTTTTTTPSTPLSVSTVFSNTKESAINAASTVAARVLSEPQVNQDNDNTLIPTDTPINRGRLRKKIAGSRRAGGRAQSSPRRPTSMPLRRDNSPNKESPVNDFIRQAWKKSKDTTPPTNSNNNQHRLTTEVILKSPNFKDNG